MATNWQVAMAGVGLQEGEALTRVVLAGTITVINGMKDEMARMDLSTSNCKSNGHCVNTVIHMNEILNCTVSL